MVGIDPEQVNISLEKYGLHIYGESEVFGEKYNQEIKIGMASEIIANIESVNYEVKNGMCKIILNMKKVEKQPIKISRIYYIICYFYKNIILYHSFYIIQFGGIE